MSLHISSATTPHQLIHSTSSKHSDFLLRRRRTPLLLFSQYSHKLPKTSLHDSITTQQTSSYTASAVQEPQNLDTKKSKSVWVNPKNPNAARLRRNSIASRNTRLAKLAGSLDRCEPTEFDVANILVALGESPTEADAVVVLDMMSNPRNAVIALRWFQGRIKLRVKKEVILYNVAFKVIRKSKNWDAAECLWNEMLENGIKPDNVTFSTVISCARLCDMPEKAVEWFEKMPEFNCEPDVVTYAVVIDAYGRAGNVEMGLRMYDRAREERWKLDPITFATVIRVYAASGNFDGALNVYEEMKAVGVKPNLVVYNTLFDAMGRAGRPWQVKTLHKDMCSKDLEPNGVTYAALIRAYSKARYAEDALGLYKEMKEKGMELNVILYNMLLAMCADIGSIDEVARIFEDMKRSKAECRPDSWSYSSLITTYSCCGKVLEAEQMLDEMLAAGFEPNIFVLTSLIQCYGKAGQFDSVVRAFDKLLELGITPDDRFCGCLLNVATLTTKEELGKIVGCIERASSQLGSLVKLLTDKNTANDVIRNDAEELLNTVSSEVRKPYLNCLIELSFNLNQLERACMLLDMGLCLQIYRDLQSKSATQWSLHVKSLSTGAALTALHVWMNDLSTSLQNGEDLPPLLGILTGHGKHKYSEKGLASSFESHLRELNAPFHEAPDKVGWFLTTKVAAVSWLESRSSPELVAA